MSRSLSDKRDGAFGAALIVLGGVISVATTTSASSAQVAGPKLFPYLVAAGLIVSGVFFIRHVLRGSSPGDGVVLNWVPAFTIFGGLCAELVILIWFGWIPAATVLFAAVAYAFGDRRVLLNAAFGVALATVLFVGFDYGLGLGLPLGSLLEAWLE